MILAIGQAADEGLPGESDGIFLAGDIAGGKLSVVDAVASGREAALAADRYLGGPGELSLQLGAEDEPTALGRVEDFARLPRLEPERLGERGRLELRTLEPGLGTELAPGIRPLDVLGPYVLEFLQGGPKPTAGESGA